VRSVVLAAVAALGCGGLTQAGGLVRYSAFCGGLDLAGDGYRVLGDMKGGRFSVRPADGRHQWIDLAVAAAVNGRALPPFVLSNGETELTTADVYTLVYTNAAARAELAFQPSKVVFRLALTQTPSVPVRTLTLCPGTRTDSDYLFDPSVGKQPYHEFPVDEPRLIFPGLASPPPWVFFYRQESRPNGWSVALAP